jgi:3-oxoacyl-[acyl-carrier-protein] synthase II
MTRTVVTGIGAMSPFGAGAKAFWTGVAGGTCAIRPVTLIETDGLKCRLAAEVPAEALTGSSRRTRADRLALAAAREAIQDAGLARAECRDAGLVIGAVGGGMLEAEAWYWARTRGVPGPSTASSLRAVLPYAHAETLGAALGLAGPRETVVAACSSGAASMALARDLITDGVAPVVVAGGADSITRICYMGFNALRLLDPEPCRPFDRERRGMSIGEGAAFVVLEDREHALARGAYVYAELAGYGITTDAYHPTSPHPEGEGMVRAMRAAVRSAGVVPADVGYVNAHGTGTPQNDRVEARAITEVFGESPPLVSSTKSMIGHTMAAAGTLEAVVTLLTIVEGVVPPTANHQTPDPEVPFDCVPRVARTAAVACAVSNSFGFGGQNVTLVFRRA